MSDECSIPGAQWSRGPIVLLKTQLEDYFFQNKGLHTGGHEMLHFLSSAIICLKRQPHYMLRNI